MTDPEEDIRFLEAALGEAQVYWVNPSPGQLDSTDALLVLQALAAFAQRGMMGRMSLKLLEKVAEQLVQQGEQKQVTLTVYDGEWALMRDALRQLLLAQKLPAAEHARLEGVLAANQRQATLDQQKQIPSPEAGEKDERP